MNVQQEQRVERTFDENGNTVEEVVAAGDEGADAAVASEEGATNPDAEAAAPPPKFRIGDREFATQDEALAFANSQISTLSTEQQIADAYRKGMLDAVGPASAQLPNVTAPPPAPKFNAEELYTNPQEFLDKYARQIKEQATHEIRHAQTVKEQSDQIWREFTDRHPILADFRQETEGFVSLHQKEVQAIIATKGRDSAYDFIATKLKARFEKYGAAVKPQRQLPNTSSTSTPNSNSAPVTSKPAAKKPLSFAEQIRSIRRGRA